MLIETAKAAIATQHLMVQLGGVSKGGNDKQILVVREVGRSIPGTSTVSSTCTVRSSEFVTPTLPTHLHDTHTIFPCTRCIFAVRLRSSTKKPALLILSTKKIVRAPHLVRAFREVATVPCTAFPLIL
jgi:3-deoxy-D-manno-octulosonic-acid transferase